MKSFRKHLLVSAIALGLSASVLAADATMCDPTGPMMQGRGMGRMSPAQRAEHMKLRMDQHHAYLHDKLKLTAEQEPAWKEFIASAKPPMMEPQTMRADMMKLSAPERMEKMMGHMKQREAHMADRLAALKKFYAVLTPEQQKVFDAEHMGRRGSMNRGGKRGGMRGMGPGAVSAPTSAPHH
ncbi:MAG: hypothetical protein C4516_01910 [Oxalobacter sp.]|nr:MAG: hypothetical protein C4516_01910 [Oxalobacter sp.]